MPKLIPELENRIIKTAEELFAGDGFDAVNMRRLAAKLDIAVGTLYNYFPNKSTLFYSILKKSWEETFAELDALISEETGQTAGTRKKALETIYDGISRRGGFAVKTFGPEKTEKRAKGLNHNSSYNQAMLIENLTERLSPFGAGFAGSEAPRIVQTIVASIRFFIFIIKSTDREGDIEFLTRLVETAQGDRNGT